MSLTISLGSLQDTVLDACSSESPAVTSQPTVLPMISEHGLRELALVKQELQALQEELQEVAEPRRAAWEAQVSSQAAAVPHSSQPTLQPCLFFPP